MMHRLVSVSSIMTKKRWRNIIFALPFLVGTSYAFAMNSRNLPTLSYLETPQTCETELQSTTTTPPTLFLHGLDSSSHTWDAFLEDFGKLGYRGVAVDQRGCGRSPLGDPEEFTPSNLVADLCRFLEKHPYFSSANGRIRPFVLVGHSMGGRIAMSFASEYPELVSALVIEDMDIRRRMLTESHVRSSNTQRTLGFCRDLGRSGITTRQQVMETFAQEGYPASQVEKWLEEGRVENVGSDDCYSQVNPAFRLLCYEQFFESNHGETTWKKLETSSFPIHVMVADPTKTVCDEDSLSRMKEAIPSAIVHRYAGATHSIHNSKMEAFLADIIDVIDGI